MKPFTALLPLAFLAVSATCLGASWPGFRGADGSGVSLESGLPSTWSESENLKWKLALPGRGNSSPVVTLKRVYLTSQTEDGGLWTFAVDKQNGKLIWKTQLTEGSLAATGEESLYAHRHNPATSTMAASESRVWAFFGTGKLFCLNPKGKIIWQRDLVQDYGSYDIAFGMASSPRLWKGSIYINCITKNTSYVVALSAQDGKTQWKTERSYEADRDGADAYSTPAIWKQGNREQILVAGADHLDAYDPKSGERLWYAGGFKIKSPYGRIIASPAVSESIIVQCAGNPGGGGLGRAIAFRANGANRADGQGQVTQSARLWSIERTAPDAATPVIYGDLVYLVRANGVTLCVDPATGKKHWEERTAQGDNFASTVAGDNKVYILNTSGTCTVLEAGATFKKLAENKLPGTFYATPAISDGALFLRSESVLYAIENASTTVQQ